MDGLAFEDDSGQTLLISGDSLSRLFELCRYHVKCVVMNACYSEAQADAIAQHIDYVVGMKKSIGDEAAIKFAVGFYDALWAGRDMEKAFKFGCSAVDLKGIPEYLTPVLKKKSMPSPTPTPTSWASQADPPAAGSPRPQSAAPPLKVDEPGTAISPSIDLGESPSDSTTSPPRPVSSNAVGPIRLFYSYSHKDEKLREKLEEHLSLLQRQGVIAGWHDRKIGAGEDWKGAIDNHLEEAQILLLLISSSFLASNYCYDVEMIRAIERHDAGTARVIPIIVRPCDWQSGPFGKLMALPKDGKAITDWRQQDKAFLDIAKGIRRVVAELNTGPTPRPSNNAGTTPPEAEDDDKVSLSASLSIAGHLVPSMGCPCLELRLVCMSKRTAKVETAALRVRGSHFITAFQESFGKDLGYKPVQGLAHPPDSLGFHFFGYTPPNSGHAFRIERGDSCKFFLPGLAIPLSLLAEAPPDDLYIEVEYIDGRKVTLLRGAEVHAQIDGLYEMCKSGQYTLKFKCRVGMNLAR